MYICAEEKASKLELGENMEDHLYDTRVKGFLIQKLSSLKQRAITSLYLHIIFKYLHSTLSILRK